MATLGTAATVALSTEAGFFANAIDIQHTGITRAAIATSTLATTDAHTFQPATLVDWGSLEITMAYTPSTLPPMTDAVGTVTTTYANGSVWTISGFMTEFAITNALEERVEATATLKLTGTAGIT